MTIALFAKSLMAKGEEGVGVLRAFFDITPFANQRQRDSL
jgi:hypothetical protein